MCSRQGSVWVGHFSISHFNSKSICFPWNVQVKLEQWLELIFCKERFCFILKVWNTLKYFPMEMTFCFCWCTSESPHHNFHPLLAAPTWAAGTRRATKHRHSVEQEGRIRLPHLGDKEQSKLAPLAQLTKAPFLTGKTEACRAFQQDPFHSVRANCERSYETSREGEQTKVLEDRNTFLSVFSQRSGEEKTNKTKAVKDNNLKNPSPAVLRFHIPEEPEKLQTTPIPNPDKQLCSWKV